MLPFIQQYIPWLNIEQLNILGFKSSHLFFIVIFIAIVIINKVIKPILVWLMRKNYMTILSYLATSSVILIIAYTVLYMTNYFTIDFMKLVIYAIVLFGVYSSTLLTYKMLKKEI